MKKEQPIVSVITVSYNAEAFIERTIKSVLSQSYEAIEYVVIDGQSKDLTLTIIQKYQHRIDYFISEPDKSLYDAMNKGIDAATGDYIVFMNSGDQFYDKDALKNAMKDCQYADLVYGKTLVIAEDQKSYRGWHKSIPRVEQLSQRSFIDGMVICHQAMIVKRSLVGYFDMKWKIAADLDWTLTFMKKIQTKHFYEDHYLVLYLDGGVSDQQRRHAVKERFKILKKHFGLLPTIWQQCMIACAIVLRGGRIKPKFYTNEKLES